jgi:hypothetical protein
LFLNNEYNYIIYNYIIYNYIIYYKNMSFFSNLGNTLSNVGKDVINTPATMVKDISHGDVLGAVTAPLKAPLDVAGSGLGAITNVASGVGSGIGSAASGIGRGIGSAAQGVGSGVGSAAQGVGSGVGSAAQGVGSGVGNVIHPNGPQGMNTMMMEMMGGFMICVILLLVLKK